MTHVQIEPSNERMEEADLHTRESFGIAVDHPFRPGWSLRLGPLRLRSVPWYWEVFRERLQEASARGTPAPPPPAHHDHYCEECDRQWVHEGHTCAHAWAFPCIGKNHQSAATDQSRLASWLIVVRRDRTELCRHLGESFAADPRVTVVVDRRQVDRRVLRAQRASVALERRRRRDRRAPHTGTDSSIWATLGFQILQPRSPDGR